MLPRKVFCNVGLLELFCKNDDQLAAILGHELSHVMMNHSEQSLAIEILQQGFTLVLISMLDFTGLFTFLFEAGLFATNVGQWLPKHFSREHEREADALGSYLAAKACYDPAAMKHAFENMLELEQKLSGGQRDTNMLSTHPATKERADNAMHRSDKYLVGVYKECTKESRCPKKEQWDTMLSLEASQN